MKITQQTLDRRMALFYARCAERDLSVTHQRWVIYRVLAGTDRHPTPEETFERVRKDIPSISFATIYKNIKTFLDAGLLKEVSTPDQTMRLDANLDSHHHIVCTRCNTIFDIPEDRLAPLQLKGGLPEGFRVAQYNVCFLGLCGHCAAQERASI
jgi:Fur family peroxide stress response transcriptional regulator